MIACPRAARTPWLICQWMCFVPPPLGLDWGAHQLDSEREPPQRDTREVFSRADTVGTPAHSQAAAGPCSRFCPAKDRAFRAMSANAILAGRARAALRASRARLQAAACCRICLPRSALIVCMVTGYMASSSVAGP
jgi:hypothetical protein